MGTLEQLAEARIREWLERPAAERDAAAVPLDPAIPLEVQLMHDITELDRQALTANDVDAAALKRRASELMLRLMVILENDGRPLAAQRFAEERQARRDQR